MPRPWESSTLTSRRQQQTAARALRLPVEVVLLLLVLCALAGCATRLPSRTDDGLFRSRHEGPRSASAYPSHLRLDAPPIDDERRSEPERTAASSEPAIAITFPRNHSWWQTPVDGGAALKFLHVHFATRDFEIPFDGYLLITGHKLPDEGLRYTGAESTFALIDVEPGSYFFTLTLRNRDHTRAGGRMSMAVLHVEVVVPQPNLHRAWRYILQEEDKKPVAFVNLPSSRRSHTKSYSSESALPPQVIPICYVGSMSGPIDGQKKMWLQLMGALSHPGRRTGNAAESTFAFQMKSFVGFQADTPMTRAVKALNVSLSGSQLSVSEEDVHRYGLTPDTAMSVLLDMFYESFPHTRDSTSFVSPSEYTKLHSIRAGFAVSYWQNLTKEFQSCRDGVLIFANSRSAGDTTLVLAARMAGVKSTVMEFANLHPEPVEVDVLLAPSHYAAVHPSVVGAVSFKRSYVLSTGVDTDVFAPEPRRRSISHHQDSLFVVGYVGRLAEDKSVGIIIATAKLVKQRCRHCRFRIIGDGPLKDDLKTLVEEWRLADCVEFVDGIYNDEPELVRQLRLMDAYFSPGLRETLGIAALEAMSVGVPVVCFATGGASEYLSDGVNSIAVSEATPEAFRDALMTLEQSPELRSEMGENARETVVERFSLDTCIAKYARLYQRLS